MSDIIWNNSFYFISGIGIGFGLSAWLFLRAFKNDLEHMNPHSHKEER